MHVFTKTKRVWPFLKWGQGTWEHLGVWVWWFGNDLLDYIPYSGVECIPLRKYWFDLNEAILFCMIWQIFHYMVFVKVWYIWIISLSSFEFCFYHQFSLDILCTTFRYHTHGIYPTICLNSHELLLCVNNLIYYLCFKW